MNDIFEKTLEEKLFEEREHAIIMARLLVLKKLFADNWKIIYSAMSELHCMGSLAEHSTYKELCKMLETMDKTVLVKALLDMGFSSTAIAGFLGITQPSVSYHKNKEPDSPSFDKMKPKIRRLQNLENRDLRKKQIERNTAHTYW